MAELQKRDYKRERLICKLYDEGHTYKQIGEQLNVTKNRIGQIYRRILKEKNKLERGAA
jgi:DNA-directed RNA polymerase sigma subunit (sigma70/sigma32)